MTREHWNDGVIIKWEDKLAIDRNLRTQNDFLSGMMMILVIR
jgi:hypothetical protein